MILTPNQSKSTTWISLNRSYYKNVCLLSAFRNHELACDMLSDSSFVFVYNVVCLVLNQSDI